MILGFLLPCLDGKWTRKTAFGLRWAWRQGMKIWAAHQVCHLLPGEVQTEGEGTLECVAEEGDEEYPFWP